MQIYIIIAVIFGGLYVCLILYYLWGWLRLKEYQTEKKQFQTFVSVIIPARNEETNIQNILQDLKDQYYPKHLFEIIVIDDFSTDNTSRIVKSLVSEQIKLFSLQELTGNTASEKSNKKLAIQKAVEQAKGELIITTDADCHAGNNWLRTIVSYYEEKKPVMIAGMVTYFYDSSFLGKFQTLDFLSLVGIGAASMSNGFYNLCNGANLAYTKEAFFQVDGYKNIDHIASGDDMMLMHKLAKKFPGKISFLKNKDALIYTHTTKDLASFWQQRLRWTSKSTHYEDKRITIILAFVYCFNLALPLCLFVGFILPPFLKIAMWLFLVKICVDTIFTYSIAKFFRRENLLWLFLPMQTIHILYIILIAPAGIFGKYQWKNRTVHQTKSA